MVRVTEAVRRRTADDRGQTAVEYLGIIAVVVAIVVLIANTNLGQTIVDKLRAQIAKVAP
ncbi:Flp family type IVb pilin [Streptomyces griseoruber]